MNARSANLWWTMFHDLDFTEYRQDGSQPLVWLLSVPSRLQPPKRKS